MLSTPSAPSRQRVELWRAFRQEVPRRLTAGGVAVPPPSLYSRAIDFFATEIPKTSGGSMQLPEYDAIVMELLRRGPCNLLVFSCGFDSRGWVQVNEGGKVRWGRHLTVAR